ncbi:hypothetical protein D1007_10717 [Hordeum vulgare]|uniref:Uncharacterized protein n=1 Tax=Hordeum vulgare subsp. vulgare TaxID=112509 RepID=A0A8I6WB02_HORVV|nr:hypothetical protein D1007_10717 [Hordeum vulgare]KAI5008162.1 hypothetical protein ZWY2020_009210 [Hordeum vulgare]
MASSAPPAFLPQLVQPVSVLPDQPPSAPAEGTGGQVMVLNDASSLPLQLMRTPPGEGAGGRIHRQLARPRPPGPPRQGHGGDGGAIHAILLEL